MDLATVLSKVDGKAYTTTAAYLADVALIAQVGGLVAGGRTRRAGQVMCVYGFQVPGCALGR